MVVDLLGPFPHLLLLLELLGPVHSRFAPPKNFTKAQWFEIQHLQSALVPCSRAMRAVNKYTRHCKPENTFIHDSFGHVAAVCDLPTITCENHQHNCHRSPKPSNVTQCRLLTGRYPDCRYKDIALYKFFIIACDPPEKTDPPYRLVPVHLDKIV